MDLTLQVLFVESDGELRKLASAYLSRNGMAVTAVSDVIEVARHLSERSFDVIVMGDMTLESEPQALQRTLEQGISSSFPILIIGSGAQKIDRNLALRFGVVDVLPKPFGGLQLLMRIRTLVRRNRLLPPIHISDNRHLLRFGDWCLDVTKGVLMGSAGVTCFLSESEHRLLEIFLQRPRRALSLIDLSSLLQENACGDHLIPVDRLRQRLGTYPDGSFYLQSMADGDVLLAASIEFAKSEAA